MVHDKPESYLIIGVIAVCTVQIGTMMTLFIPRLARVMSKQMSEFDSKLAKSRLSTMNNMTVTSGPTSAAARGPVPMPRLSSTYNSAPSNARSSVTSGRATAAEIRERFQQRNAKKKTQQEQIQTEHVQMSEAGKQFITMRLLAHSTLASSFDLMQFV